MSIKSKPSVLMIVLFVLTSLATILGLYVVIESLILSDDVKSSLAMFSKSITPGQYYTAVAIICTFIVMKWVGSFIMFLSRPWGFILYVIPNLILLSLMLYLLAYNFRTDNIYVFAIGTFAFIAVYVVALICIINKRKKARNAI
jgi:hypothetical protein